MSILIKNMEMPRHCGECSLLCEYDGCYFCGYEDGLLYTFGDIDGIRTKRPDKCPLTEVPTPHGRLIDADELEALCNYPNWSVNKKIISEIPTVIESED